ncbi:MAG: M3 family oligoendopeptidase [Candidatus Woesearchaeota archaeon]
MAIWNVKEIIEPEGLEEIKIDLIEKVKKFKSYRQKLNRINEKTFIEIIQLKENIIKLINRLSSYTFLQTVEDTSNIKNNALENEISNLITNLVNEMIFFNLWFKQIDNKLANKVIKSSGKSAYYFKSIRKKKKYPLNEDIEKIINLKDLSGNDQLNKLYDIITNRYKFKFNNKKLTLEELKVYIRSIKRNERKTAYDLILNKYKEEEAILGEIYYSIVLDYYNENIKTRNFKSPINVRNISNDVSDKSVEAMLNSVKKNISLFHEYFKIKGKIIGRKIDRYDIYTNLKEERKIYSYNKSKEIVLQTYSNFSNTFYDNARLIFDKKHVHSEIKKNKRSGAFCLSVNNDYLPYIMLNHVDTLDCLFTMIHELGHGIHAILSNKNPEVLSSSSLPLAETASIFSEMLLSQKLLNESNNEIKKEILIKMIDSEYASIIRQTYFTLFEIEAHEKIPKGASIKDLNDIYLKLLKEQFGNNFKIDDKFKHEWKYIPHIYHSPFYCYSYAFANLLVLALYDIYLKEPENFKIKFITLLSKGSTNSPKNLLKEIGIDIENEKFWDRGFNIIEKQINELKKLINFS